MEVISKYIAFDGTEFDNEHDCSEHEVNLLWDEANQSVEFYDQAGNPVLVENTGDYEDKVAYIIIRNYGEYCDLVRVLDEIGYSVPEVDMSTPLPAVFHYTYEWQNITEFLPGLAKLNDMIKER